MSALYNGAELMQFEGLMIGQPYWYACHCQNCTQDLYNRKSAQWPSYYERGPEYGADYAHDIEAKNVGQDCVGLQLGFFWADGDWRSIINAIGTGSEIAFDYQVHGIPDHSADEFYHWCTAQVEPNEYGTFDTLPRDVPCLLLHSPGHCGLYVGNEHSIECSFGYSQVIYLPVDNRRFAAWTDWSFYPDWLIDRIPYAPYVPMTPATLQAVILGGRRRRYPWAPSIHW